MCDRSHGIPLIYLFTMNGWRRYHTPGPLLLLFQAPTFCFGEHECTVSRTMTEFATGPPDAGCSGDISVPGRAACRADTLHTRESRWKASLMRRRCQQALDDNMS